MVSDAEFQELKSVVAHRHAELLIRIHNLERDVADAEAAIHLLRREKETYGREY